MALIMETQGEKKNPKKPFFCLKFSPKNFILPKIAYTENLYFQNRLLGGLKQSMGYDENF